MTDLLTIRTTVEKAWSIETTYTPDAWTTSNRALGQCAVTALLVQSLLGGVFMKGMVAGKPHYWNRVNGIDVDLTWRQFPTGMFVNHVEVANRNDLVYNDWMQGRFDILVKRFNALL